MIDAVPRSLEGSERLDLQIRSVEELAHECARFHDYPFHLERQSFDDVQRVWTASFVRRNSDPARVTSRGSWLLNVVEFPLIDSEIAIHNVLEAEIQDRSQIGIYTLRRVHAIASGCRFEFHQDCDIYINVAGPFTAELRDVGEVRGARGRIISVGFMAFGVGITGQ
jgi:hypothetical protein